jgi:hypothetical protein
MKLLIIRVVVLVFAISPFLSCERDKDPKAILLKGDCFWDILDRQYSLVANTCWKFKEDGSCYYFSYHFGEYGRRKDSVSFFDEDDNRRSNYWKIYKDSLEVRNSEFQILKYNNDTFFLKLANQKDTLFLIRNCKTSLVSRSTISK